MRMKEEKMRRSMHFYIIWPLVAVIFPAACAAWAFTVEKRAGFILLGVSGFYLLLAIIFYGYNRNRTYDELVRFAEHYASAQNSLFRDLDIPYAIVLSFGKVIWMNTAFKEAVGPAFHTGLSITHLFPELNTDIFGNSEEEKVELNMPYGDRDFRVSICRVKRSAVEKLEAKPGVGELYAVYLYDETELNQYIRQNEDERLVTGLVYIDNFDEVMDDVEEVRQSLLLALIDQRVSQFISSVDGIAKKMENDKYFIIFKQKYYDQLAGGHFAILEDVKSINVGNDIAPTLSIGIGMHCATLNQCYEYARIAIDMALGRGGDQCVVKEKDHLTYFGGKTQQTGKNTRVRARVKAEALREFILGKERVIIMGHAMADIDSFGSAMGIYRIAKTLGRRAHIVIDEVTTSVKPFLESVQKDEQYEKDLIVSTDEVIDLVNRNTLVIVVDTNKPDYTQCPELLGVARTVIVLDHHRTGEEVIPNTVLSYIEPNASSASEMVTEIMQYVDEGIRVRPIEADCMFAGMMIDTNNFMTKTGVRTFEAAAYLKGYGADIVRIRKMFREDIDSYRAKAETIHRAEVYRRSFAIAVFPADADVPSPTILGAQAANEMLDIRGVKASFVLTEYHGKIYVSARSIDEINVQIIMEHMGGGGHISTAGTQFHHTNMKEAVASLKATIDELIEGGDI